MGGRKKVERNEGRVALRKRRGKEKKERKEGWLEWTKEGREEGTKIRG